MRTKIKLEPPYDMRGLHVVVRTNSAGVHMGIFRQREADSVILEDACRVFSWAGAFTLSELSTYGLAKESRLSVKVPIIEVLGAIEIIPTTQTARDTYAKAKVG